MKPRIKLACCPHSHAYLLTLWCFLRSFGGFVCLPVFSLARPKKMSSEDSSHSGYSDSSGSDASSDYRSDDGSDIVIDDENDEDGPVSTGRGPDAAAVTPTAIAASLRAAGLKRDADGRFFRSYHRSGAPRRAPFPIFQEWPDVKATGVGRCWLVRTPLGCGEPNEPTFSQSLVFRAAHHLPRWEGIVARWHVKLLYPTRKDA